MSGRGTRNRPPVGGRDLADPREGSPSTLRSGGRACRSPRETPGGSVRLTLLSPHRWSAAIGQASSADHGRTLRRLRRFPMYYVHTARHGRTVASGVRSPTTGCLAERSGCARWQRASRAASGRGHRADGWTSVRPREWLHAAAPTGAASPRPSPQPRTVAGRPGMFRAAAANSAMACSESSC